ncbi:cyclohexanone monooxygenase [Phascolomyces articulosus]|uniref:Cyclohexanone monooxygenase n=1 Tax=Phascolomyces articulosus TaxID=60185 RepID=A0AAD5KAQ2_9FUNG|nr:cyclohexanone monooxygenase [Phascolomyces articulosus]
MSTKKDSSPTIAIIGTGFSGICAAIQLEKQLGIKAQLFEICKDIGGVWNVNQYIGIESYAPSHLYSLSFEPNPSWKERFSSQSEIHNYMKGVAKKYHLYERTKFETEVIQLEWQEKQQQWFVQWRNVNNHQETESGIFDFVISGVGLLRIANIPKEFLGFEGPIIHTAYWDSSIDYTNKRIAIIGSGATAIQVIPKLRKVTSHIYSYQRTPAWVLIRKQYSYSGFAKFIFRWVPFAMKLYRIYLYFLHESYHIGFGNHKMLGAITLKYYTKTMTSRLVKAGRPDLIPALIPDYPPGCKRICQSETYLEAMAQPNVSVIRSGVKEIRGRTLVDKDGNETEADILILATGFDTKNITGNLEVYGRGGRSLRKYYEETHPQTYKTIAVHGFPNYFFLAGPGSNLGHNSIIQMIEAQTQHAIKIIKAMKKNNIAAIEPTQSAQDEYFAATQKSFEGTVWKGGCTSWYLDNKGAVHALWSKSATAFWIMLQKPNFNDFIQYRKNKENRIRNL